jgi:hypothetical protein
MGSTKKLGILLFVCLVFSFSTFGQFILEERQLRGGVTADGYNLRFESGFQKGIYNLEIPASAQKIEKAYLTVLFTGSYLSLLPQQFELGNDTYTFSQKDIKTTLSPTPYAVDEKAYIAAIDVTKTILVGRNGYPYQFLNTTTGSSNRLTSTYLTVLYADTSAEQIQVAIILNNKMPSSGKPQALTYRMPKKISANRSAVLSVWADYACNMPWMSLQDYFNIYFNKQFLGTIAGGLMDQCFGSLGSFGYFKSKITPTNSRSIPDMKMDSTDALSDVSTLVGTDSLNANFEFKADNQNISHFLCGYVFAYRTEDEKEGGECNPNTLIKLYPTPFKDYLTINKQPSACVAKLTLFNSLGQLLIRDKEIMDGENIIYLSYLASGIYFYHVRTEKGSISGKVMKINGY